MTGTSVDRESFRLVADYVRDISGIVLEPGKEYLVENRLKPVLRDAGGISYTELIRKARADASGDTRASIIDAVTTNETSFMRDGKPFDVFQRKLLPSFAERARAVRIWSAACATGQEPYSLAMLAKEQFGELHGGRVDILATDISDHALQIAREGIYNRAEVTRGLSEARLRAHFRPCPSGWQVRSELRQTITFRSRNLQLDIRDVGPQDIVFCRNVAIYFALEARNRLFYRIAEVLRPGGVLLVGSTESLLEVRDVFEREEVDGVVYYRRR